jgi:outer membrane usher protein FimD/PapC
MSTVYAGAVVAVGAETAAAAAAAVVALEKNGETPPRGSSCTEPCPLVGAGVAASLC